MTSYHPRPRFVTLDPILVVDYFSRTLNTMDFKMNLFSFITFITIESGSDVAGNAVVCAVTS